MDVRLRPVAMGEKLGGTFSRMKKALAALVASIINQVVNSKAVTSTFSYVASSVLFIKSKGAKMIGAMEKELEAARLRVPPRSVVDGVDLSKVASYVTYKAATAKSKVSLEIALVALIILNVHLGWMVSDLVRQNRLKDYIMVPSKLNTVTPVTPHRLDERQVHKAFQDYVGLLTNINRTNIRSNYKILQDYMSGSLRVKFESESEPFVDNVIRENIAEYIEVGDHLISPESNGTFRATVPIKVFTSVDGVVTKPRKEHIVMKLRVVNPTAENTWALQIERLHRLSASGFDSLERKRR